jgi:hypothetical protein
MPHTSRMRRDDHAWWPRPVHEGRDEGPHPQASRAFVGGIIPGVESQALKKLAIDEHALLKLLGRWRGEAEKKGHRITRIAVAFEAGHDGFWLARWLAAQGIEAQ